MVPLAPRKQMMARYVISKNLLPSTLQQQSSFRSGISSQGMARKSRNDTPNTDWRRYGIEKRRQLLEEDEALDGHMADLNYKCRIQGYFALSEKIIAKFHACFASENDLEGTYVMGNRLCHFLTEALPRHPAYMKKDPVVSRLRENSLKSLIQINQRIEALALRIDEEQLNKYIAHDFDPFADDDDDDSSTSSCSEVDNFSSSLDSGAKDDPQWESFDGWSFDLPDKLTQKPVDELPLGGGLSSGKDLDVSAETEDTSNETFSSSEMSFQASDDHEPIYDSYGSDFLKRIASEGVRYETDSDADDSWAQECEAEVESAIYSSTSLSHTCDPARIALRELMINKRERPHQSSKYSIVEAPTDEFDDDDQPEDSKENQSLSFDLSPDNSFDSEKEEQIGTAFDPTARLPNKPTSGYADRVSL